MASALAAFAVAAHYLADGLATVPGPSTAGAGALLGFAGLVRPWHLALAAFASGCAYATEFPARRRMAAELDQARLLRMEREREGGEPRRQRFAETDGIGLVLEPDDDVVGVAHDHDVALGLLPSPAVGPKIEGVVQVHVGEQR